MSELVADEELSLNLLVHGLLMYVSTGLAMPVGVVVIRWLKYAKKQQNEGKQSSCITPRVLYKTHLILQIAGFFILVAGMLHTFLSFPLTWKHTHGRLGLGLFIMAFIQMFLGKFRPKPEGGTIRKNWYGVHWLVGTTFTILCLFNIYSGLDLYHNFFPFNKHSQSIKFQFCKHTQHGVNIFFSILLSFITLAYLVQDRWGYLTSQGKPSICATATTTHPYQLPNLSCKGDSCAVTPLNVSGPAQV